MQKPVADGAAELSIEEVIGFWAIFSVSGSGDSCHISLNRLPEADGYGVFIEKCSIAALSRATEWRPTRDGFDLRDGSHASVARFRRIGVDRFEATDGAYRMERASLS